MAVSLSNERAAIGWMLAAALFFTAESVLIKSLGKDWPAPLQLFWRQVAALIVLLPLIIRRGAGLWRTPSPWLIAFRSAIGALGLLCSIYAITHLPLATANALSFTRPLMLTLLAAWFLHEKLNGRRAAALAIGFAGVIVMVGPDVGQSGSGLAYAAALSAAFLFAASLLSIKMMSADHHPYTLLVYGVVLGLVLAAPLALADWRWPDRHDAMLLFLMGAFSIGTILCTINALASAEASTVAPWDYVRLPLAAVAGAILFGHQLDWPTVIGAGLIVAAAAIAGRYGNSGHAMANKSVGVSFPVLRDGLDVAQIRAFFETEVSAQMAEAMAHMQDNYWTDSRTGHNIGKDELAAARLMQTIIADPIGSHDEDPAHFAERLLARLDAIGESYRLNHNDPDGYGIATIGTIARRLRIFCYG